MARYPPRNVLNAKHGKGPRDALPWIPTATHNEPPFPIMEGKSAFQGMKNFSENNRDRSKTINVLDLLRSVYELLGNREDVLDPWLQRRATKQSPEALQKYHNKQQIFQERFQGELKAPMTLRQVFKNDKEVGVRVSRVLQERGQPASNSSKRTAVYSALFDEKSNRPGAMDRVIHLVDKDHERYANDLKVFNQKLERYDRDHGLLPRQPSSETS